MSIQTDVAVQNMQKTVEELSLKLAALTASVSATAPLDIVKRVDDLEAKYKMLNARVGWNKDKAA
jgi:hypothetical protein